MACADGPIVPIVSFNTAPNLDLLLKLLNQIFEGLVGFVRGGSHTRARSLCLCEGIGDSAACRRLLLDFKTQKYVLKNFGLSAQP